MMVIEHAFFIRLMHVTSMSMTGTGVVAGVGRYSYQKCGPYKRVNPTTEGDPDKKAEEETQEAVAEAKKEDEEEVKKEGEEDEAGDWDADFDTDEADAYDIMQWALGGAALGTLGGLLSGPIYFHYSSMHLAWNQAWWDTGVASMFYVPFFIGVAATSSKSVAKNLPACIRGTVATGALLSIAAFFLPGAEHGAHGHGGHGGGESALYYLAACRIAVSGVSSIMALLFVQRYASIQMNKRRDDTRATPATDKMNWVAIRFGQIGGNAIAAMWCYVAYTDWAGAHYPHFFNEVPEVYFLCATVHLLAPSKDHDNRAGTLMARSGLVALHALLFIPPLHGHVAHNVQIICGQALTAAWFGTFDGEWRGPKYMAKKKAEIDHHTAHEGHEKAEAVEAGEQGADFCHHLAHALSAA